MKQKLKQTCRQLQHSDNGCPTIEDEFLMIILVYFFPTENTKNDFKYVTYSSFRNSLSGPTHACLPGYLE